MGDLFLLSEAQMGRLSPHFPLSHGMPRVDDRRVVSGIVYVIRNGLQWKDAPTGYGPHKTLYNRFIRWSRLGVFDRIFAGLAGEGPKPERIMIDVEGAEKLVLNGAGRVFAHDWPVMMAELAPDLSRQVSGIGIDEYFSYLDDRNYIVCEID